MGYAASPQSMASVVFLVYADQLEEYGLDPARVALINAHALANGDLVLPRSVLPAEDALRLALLEVKGPFAAAMRAHCLADPVITVIERMVADALEAAITDQAQRRENRAGPLNLARLAVLPTQRPDIE